MQETQDMWAQPLDQDNPLEQEMATCSNILAWKFPWTGEPAGFYRVTESQTWLSDRACSQKSLSQIHPTKPSLKQCPTETAEE